MGEQAGTMGAAAGGTLGGPVRCPRCRAACRWHGNPHRPFCSLTCRLLDLGVWLDEGYRVASDPDDDAR